MTGGGYTLAEVARHLGLEPPARAAGRRFCGIAPLGRADAGHIAFATRAQLRAARDSDAGLLLVPDDLSADDAEALGQKSLLLPCADPYLGYAMLSALFVPPAEPPGVHESAVVHGGAEIGRSVHFGPGAVVGDGCKVGDGVRLGPGTVLGRNVCVGKGSRLAANVSAYDGVRMGERCLIHSGAVLGADGFGFARREDGSWHRIEQLGTLVIGDDVEIGANTTIDRGAMDDTRIGDGVKLDNNIMIAHNCTVGAHTAMASHVAVAGSSHIGAHCTVGGQVGVAGHLRICDNVVLSAKTLVTRSIEHPGTYSSSLGFGRATAWRRNAVLFRHLTALARRLARLEKSQS